MTEDEVRKLSAVITVPAELLADYVGGFDGYQHGTYVRPPWRRRLRWQIGVAREWLAYRAFRVIAGFEVPDYGE